MSEVKQLFLPLSDNDIASYHAGDVVEISGIIYTARDAAHKRLVELLENNKSVPIDLKGCGIYYVGPSPRREGEVIGSAGPTSSYRMDPYTLPLLKEGLKIMIGKGPRADYIKDYLKEYKAIYLSAIGGAAASIAGSIKECELVCYEDLGAEAIYMLRVEKMFAIVTYDIYGNDLFKEGILKYHRD